MQDQRTESAGGAICVAHGYGLKIYVHRGHLIVHDGIGRQRQTRRYHRVSSKLRRLVLIGHTGFVSLEALRWLRDVGAAVVQLDANAELIATSVAAGRDFAALRRAQALAADSPVGLEIARAILADKVEGQGAVLDELAAPSDISEPVQWALREIQTATDLDALLTAEAQAAATYWMAWAPIEIRVPPRDACKLPEHWRTFGQRASLITGGPRKATNPANAILNYLYSLLEAETIFACYSVGLDPGLGIIHRDKRDRASLALDLMEVVRPTVDAYLLALLTQRTLSRRDFVETRQGASRLMPRLATELAGTCEVWRTHIAPVVEEVAHILADRSPTRQPKITPLTESNRKRAWEKRMPERKQRRSRAEFAELPSTCRDCGAPLPDRHRRYCEDCRQDRFNSQGNRARQRAADVLAQLRTEHRDPAHGGRAAELRGSKNATHQKAVRAWTGERPDPEVFRAEILPGLRHKPIDEIVSATDLSEHYCSLIRLGKKTPHPRHWEALRRLVR